MRIVKAIKLAWRRIRHWCCKIGLCNLDKCKCDCHESVVDVAPVAVADAEEAEIPDTHGRVPEFPPLPPRDHSVEGLTCAAKGCNRIASRQIPEASEYQNNRPDLCPYCDPNSWKDIHGNSVDPKTLGF